MHSLMAPAATARQHYLRFRAGLMTLGGQCAEYTGHRGGSYRSRYIAITWCALLSLRPFPGSAVLPLSFSIATGDMIKSN